MTAIQQGQWVLYTAYLCLGVGVFVLARMLLEEQDSLTAQENLSDVRNRDAKNPLLKLLRPFFNQYLVPLFRGKSFFESRKKDFHRRIIASGLKEELIPEELMGFKLILILFFPIIMTFLKVGDFLDVSWLVILSSGAIGWFYPDFWMRGRMEARQKSILRSMPFIVDLLALSTEAGLDFVGAISKVVEKSKPSPLVEELSQLLKEMRVGASRQEGLREMALRISMSEMNSFVAILISADQMGASIGKILRQQSEQIRSQRILRAEKAGAAAAQKVLFPLILFILPAVLLMIFGPFIIEMVYPGTNTR